ncbi:MAG: flagellar brake protein, partial [Spirochaetaceae bacterium]
MIYLQTSDFFQNPDPETNLMTLLIFAGILVAGAIGAVLTSRSGGARQGTAGPAGGSTGPFTRIAVKRAARSAGLSRDQIRTLMRLIKRYNVQDPMRLFRNNALLTGLVRRAVQDLDTSSMNENERESLKYVVFQIKRRISLHMSGRITLGSTRRLRVGRDVQVSPDSETWYDAKIATNLPEALVLTAPVDRHERPLLWSKGTSLSCRVLAEESGKLYTFDTHVSGIRKSRNGTSILVAHTSDVQETQKRRFPRREMDMPAFFWPVFTMSVGTGRKAKKRAFVSDERRGVGRLEDISAGGCSIRTQRPLRAGTLIKVEFETWDRTKLSAFGKVRSTQRTPLRYGVMHIMFTRVSRKNLNMIQSYVYGIAEQHVPG